MNEFNIFAMLYIDCEKAEDDGFLSIPINSIAMIEEVFDEDQNENCVITLTTGNRIKVTAGCAEVITKINDALNRFARGAHSFCSYHFGINE